jgi:putative endopeptidase
MGNIMKTLVSALVLTSLCACTTGTSVKTTTAEYGDWGIDLTARNTEVAPGDDFYRYANGQWLRTTEIPADKSGFGTFEILGEKSNQQVQQIVESMGDEKNSLPGSRAQLVGDFYTAWMNEKGVEDLGLAELAAQLQAIESIKNRTALVSQLAQIQNSSPFDIWIIPDPANATQSTVFVMQSGLGLPSRDHYLSNDSEFEVLREQYVKFMGELSMAAGHTLSAERVRQLITLEANLAAAHWSEVDNRQLDKIYNPMTLTELQERAPAINWRNYFDAAGLSEMDNAVVMQPSAFATMADLIATGDLQTWKDYLTFHFIKDHAEFLPSAISDLHFDFYQRQLRGVTDAKPRAERGTELVNERLGDAVGQLYVERHFSPAAKSSVDALVTDLLAVLEERLQQNRWMDEPTRGEALKKLSTFEARIGYPEKWTDYAGLDIASNDLLGNILRMKKFMWQREVQKLEGPVDRSLWQMPAQSISASYMPMLNQITFTAGILQPPFFDHHADPAVNYGAIGVVIGHEISHGYDDQGRRFDEKGQIRDWWSPEVAETYGEITSALVTQFNQYSPVAGLHINGAQTLGENISDLAGVELAYAAFQRYKAQHGEPPVLDGLTGDQRFFLATAQALRSKHREESLREHLLKAPHSPEEFRINGILRNMDAWYEAFDVSPEHELYLPPEERVSLW